MEDHPIQGLMTTALANIKEMIDVNTIIGDAITTPDGTVILPVSKVTFGFAAGGGDYPTQKQTPTTCFGGGSSAAVTIKPIAFIVSAGGNIKLLQISDHASSIDKIIELVPDLVDKISNSFKKNNKTDEDVTVEF